MVIENKVETPVLRELNTKEATAIQKAKDDEDKKPAQYVVLDKKSVPIAIQDDQEEILKLWKAQLVKIS